MRAACLGLLLLGCSHPASPPARAAERYGSTDSRIALGNLQGDLATGEALLRKQPGSAAHVAIAAAALVPLYLTRGQLLGRLTDYDRAEELAALAVERAPGDRRAWVARAQVHARFHEFEAARADLSRAEKLGADDLEQQRASIDQATGRYPEARRVREKWAHGLPRLETLGALATLDADEGRVDEAERHFAEALEHRRDVSPLPLAWLWLQEGTLLESVGRQARARELLEAAHQRLPEDVGVASHLAAISERDTAISLLRQIVAVSDDPEHRAALGELTGDEQMLEQAARRYDELLRRHPAAFADHAARFYLKRDPRRALALAEANLKVRRTAESLALVVKAANAAAAHARACAAADEGLARFPTSPRLRIEAYTAFARCGRQAHADEQLAALQAR